MDYKDAGVDRPAADAAKARIKALAKGTFNASVLSEIGAFGGLFRPDLQAYQEPVLVASTDGVGTKIKVAIEAGRHDGVG
jgi:phosphoribosylformylglycinamidine cyclo-ligase